MIVHQPYVTMLLKHYTTGSSSRLVYSEHQKHHSRLLPPIWEHHLAVEFTHFPTILSPPLTPKWNPRFPGENTSIGQDLEFEIEAI